MNDSQDILLVSLFLTPLNSRNLEALCLRISGKVIHHFKVGYMNDCKLEDNTLKPLFKFLWLQSLRIFSKLTIIHVLTKFGRLRNFPLVQSFVAK